jgi:hypothetical protein
MQVKSNWTEILTPFQCATRHSRHADIGHIRLSDGWPWFLVHSHIGRSRPVIESIQRVVLVWVQLWRSHCMTWIENTEQHCNCMFKLLLFQIKLTCAQSLGIHVADPVDTALLLLFINGHGIIWHCMVVAGLFKPLHFSGDTISSRFLHTTERCCVPEPHDTGH